MRRPPPTSVQAVLLSKDFFSFEEAHLWMLSHHYSYTIYKDNKNNWYFETLRISDFKEGSFRTKNVKHIQGVKLVLGVPKPNTTAWSKRQVRNNPTMNKRHTDLFEPVDTRMSVFPEDLEEFERREYLEREVDDISTRIGEIYKQMEEDTQESYDNGNSQDENVTAEIEHYFDNKLNELTRTIIYDNLKDELDASLWRQIEQIKVIDEDWLVELLSDVGLYEVGSEGSSMRAEKEVWSYEIDEHSNIDGPLEDWIHEESDEYKLFVKLWEILISEDDDFFNECIKEAIANIQRYSNYCVEFINKHIFGCPARENRECTCGANEGIDTLKEFINRFNLKIVVSFDIYAAIIPDRLEEALEEFKVEKGIKKGGKIKLKDERHATDQLIWQHSQSTAESPWEFVGYEVYRLTTLEGFRHDGRIMKHCVATHGYFDKYKAGELEILSVVTPDHKKLFTIEVRMFNQWSNRDTPPEAEYYVKQIKGKGNRLPGLRGNNFEPFEVELMVEWAKANNFDPYEIEDLGPGLAAYNNQPKSNPVGSEYHCGFCDPDNMEDLS